jgi:hypothetical protein
VSTQSVSLLQNVPSGSVLLATFTQGTDTQGPDDYTATVAWGDNQIDSSTSTPSPIMIIVQGDLIEVYGQHTYATFGAMSVVVGLSSTTGGGTALALPSVNVAANVTSEVGVTRSGLIYNRGTRLFGGTLTVTNEGTSSFNGALDVLLSGLSSDATLASASVTIGKTTYSLSINMVNGVPEIMIPQALVNDLAPGQSLSISLFFLDPSLGSISYTPEIFFNPDS